MDNTIHMPPSLWADTAPPSPPRTPLDEHARADVLVVGGGFTGLSAALFLAARGIDTLLLEAHAIGWGASGRNGGQVIPGLKYDPEELVARYGPERGQRMVDISGRNADIVFELIHRHGISCDARQCGWIQPAATRAGLRTTERRAQQWADQGVEVAWLDERECAERLGTNAYLGGWLDPRAGALNPLAYARGLADAAEKSGARLFEHSKVRGLARIAGQWHADLDGDGKVVAGQVLICTNGYSDELQKGLSKSIIAANSYQIATRPLDEAEGKAILPGGEIVSDTRKLLLYFRRDSTGRLLMGGRGPFHEPRGKHDFAHLQRAISRLYPALEGIDIDYRWAGRVALTRDALPHVHQPAPGMLAALGYNGRGVAMATHLGKLIGESWGKEDLEKTLPFPITPIRPIPLHGLQRCYVGTVVSYYRLKDWLER